MTRTRSFAILLALLVVCSQSASADAHAPRIRRIRTTDGPLRALVEDGVVRSPTFRALVERLERSDVVVYLECDGLPRSRIAGRLTFVSSAGGNRYVVVRVARLEPRGQRLAMLGHELQHAVEIAETPSIVDAESMAREYQRFGHINDWTSSPGIAYDSAAAIVAGRQVLGEIGGLSGE